MQPTPNKRQNTSFLWGASALAVVLGLVVPAAFAQKTPPPQYNELIQPPVCSSEKPIPSKLKGLCEVTPLPKVDKETPKKVKVYLKAQTSEIDVGGFKRPPGSEIVLGGYRVITENYNGTYLPPVVQAMPGDIVAASLVNMLAPRELIGLGSQPHTHKHGDANSTNLHYFHGGIVTPNNARKNDEDDGSQGDGDNVYVRLKNGFFKDKDGKQRPHTFEYSVPIPGKKKLDAGVLESEQAGKIAHPDGLNWYHSHMHGRSSDQVMGGLAGLLSVGKDTANVRAKCGEKTPAKQCNDNTKELKRKTIVRYALLRDISLRNISALPDDAPQDSTSATAEWAPEVRNFHSDSDQCGVWKKNGSDLVFHADPEKHARLREGFCQRDRDSAWLFTLNGQRFPTITVERDRNLLLRIANLSANVAYWLELKQDSGKTHPLTILSVDGVVPAQPAFPGEEGAIDAMEVKDFLLMPASRAEIYLPNDSKHDDEQVYILRSKELDAGVDKWPEIQLARLVLKPNPVARKIPIGLNAPTLQVPPPAVAAAPPVLKEADKPNGCVRDLLKGEHRRVIFWDPDDSPEQKRSVSTEIRRLKSGNEPGRYYDPDSDFESDPTATIGKKDADGSLARGLPFEHYEKSDGSGSIDWLTHKHVCIRLDNNPNSALRRLSPSYQQLWALRNDTNDLHNFHIHQMKFRLATEKDLRRNHIEPPQYSHVCAHPEACTCSDGICNKPDYKFFERDSEVTTPASYPRWHDTIAIPGGSTVYIIMSFTAEEQIGRYVFHCHILKHEDTGLMAPIEVWGRYKIDR